MKNSIITIGSILILLMAFYLKVDSRIDEANLTAVGLQVQINGLKDSDKVIVEGINQFISTTQKEQ